MKIEAMLLFLIIVIAIIGIEFAIDNGIFVYTHQTFDFSSNEDSFPSPAVRAMLLQTY